MKQSISFFFVNQKGVIIKKVLRTREITSYFVVNFNSRYFLTQWYKFNWNRIIICYNIIIIQWKNSNIVLVENQNLKSAHPTFFLLI